VTTGRSDAEIRRFLRDAVADLLDVDPASIEEHRPLTELGIGSRDAVGIVGDLEDFLDRDLDATLVWKTPTIAALAAALSGVHELHDHGQSGASGGDHALPERADQQTRGDHAPPGPGGPGGAPIREREDADPVAIVGLGCRLPGGIEGPEAFWELLRTGRDALGEVPEGRWEQFGGTTAAARRAVARTTRRGGFLSDVEHFDADYFGISPREAELMDPQQRMLLEVTIEALEHAGIAPERLRGSDTGVFVGMSSNEYGYLTMGDPARVDAWTATGAAFAIAANRVSYLLDLRGPSMTTDTACSSSLVALHQARRAIESGEITTAVVAGVNLLLSPSVTMTFDQAGATAPAGGCKPFSADADGIARAEGCGVVVVKRLSAALADGDRVLAVVRGSAVNSDGRSNGITAPNPLAQEAVLRAAYREAGLDPATVDYVEAHGTGTLLGDPIEASALGAVLGSGRPAVSPLGLGSVKSNLGHLEAAAGVAGVLKVVLAMTHGVIPPSLHYSAPNPHIRFDDWRLDVVTEPRPWPRYAGVARAGVSGFGFGGTNAHVILEEWPGPAGEASAGTAPDDDEVAALELSGATEERVRAQSGALATWLTDTYAGAVVPLRDVAHTLARRRDRRPACAVVAARGREALADALRRHAAGEESAPGAVVLPAVPRTGRLRPETSGAVWVFSGIGSQWAGMGRRLLAEEPAFAAAIDELEPHVVREAGFSLRELVATGSRANGVAATQVALFGMQIALAALWRSYGARPAAVVGNSMGEISAAVVAGALDVADGVRVMAVRSRLLEEGEKVSSGGMAVVELADEEFARVADRFPDVTVCVHASPSTLTVGSMDGDQLGELVRYVESLGRNAWPLKVRGAAHSAAVEPMLDDLAAGIAGISPRPATVPFYSTASADPREDLDLGVAYWLRNLRRPVRFAQAIAACAEDGHAAFLEVSPHPVAVAPIRQSVAGRIGSELLVLPTLRRDGDDVVTFRAHALALHAAGLLDADVVVPPARQADLPLPAWQRRRFWVDGAAAAGGPTGRAGVSGGHPLLGLDVDLPEGDRHVWRGDAGTAPVAWLDDHRVFGVPVLPVAAYAEMALTAGRRALAPDAGPDAVALVDLELHEVMVLGDHTEVTTSVSLGPDGHARVDVWARPPGAGPDVRMTRHATATVVPVTATAGTGGDGSDPAGDPGVLDVRAADGTPVDLYARLAELGHVPGPAFRGLRDARVTDRGVAVARAELPGVVTPDLHYTVHPVLLDACLQALVVSALHLAEGVEDAGSRSYLPAAIGGVRVLADPGRGGVVTAELHAIDEAGEGLSGRLRLVADDGTPLLEVTDVYLRRIHRSEVPEAPATAGEGDLADDGWPGAEALRAQNPAVARGLLMDRLRSRVAWVMGHRPEDVDATVPLSSLGVDSLMAVRAKNAMEHDVGVTLPVRLLLQGASLADLEAYLATELGIDVAPAPEVAPVAPPAHHHVEHYVDPRDSTERWLTTVWEKVLGVRRPGVSTPLATLGADDARFREVLLLVHDRMASQIGAGEEMHGTFDDEAFLAAATIEQQADLVRHRLEDNHGSPLRVIAEGEPGEPPLFLFHPAGGTTAVYFSLVAHLDPRVPVYGFERLDGVPLIGDKVARYVELIREIQPAGPYRLGGWSFGGALAYETARYFRGVGEEVSTLFMIDSILARKDGTDEREMLRGRFERFKAYLVETYGLDLDLDVDALVELPEDEQIATFMRAVQDAGLNLSPELMEHQRTSYEDARTAERFEPQAYEGHVILYRATDRGLTTTLDPRYARTEDALGWDVYCPSLEIVKIPGDHTSLIDPPHVDVMAQHLRQVLSEVVRHV
jgi:phthiocerol/phenolphthiocerol synthesis type-I polyketide synthase D